MYEFNSKSIRKSDLSSTSKTQDGKFDKEDFLKYLARNRPVNCETDSAPNDCEFKKTYTVGFSD